MPLVEIIYRLILGTVLGAIIGVERSFFKKQAGLRTFALVSLGATLFSLIASYLPTDSSARILANIILGIGFLGSGLIFLKEEHIFGLTTAAALWTTAGVGLAVGQGFYLEAFTVTILILIILALLPYIEERLKNE